VEHVGTLSSTSRTVVRRYGSHTYGLRPFGTRLRNAGVLHEAQLGDGIVSMVTMSDCYRIGIEALRDDIYFFLKEPPKYLPDAVPVA
jgi:hypothetical protein